MDRRTLLLALALTPAAARAALAEGESADGVPLTLSAVLAGSNAPLATGLHWRIYAAEADSDGNYPLERDSTLAQPVIPLPRGDYVVHVSFGLASAAQRVFVDTEPRTLQLALKAGALRINGALGDQKIDPARLQIDIYVPDRNNPLGKLVYPKAKADEVIGVPEGTYHVSSTLMQLPANPKAAAGAAMPTNSTAGGEVKVPSGKIVEVTMHHRFANLTLKLVNAPGAEALANSSFTVLTPGGDLIGELIGAFPSIILAEGEYVAVARHDFKDVSSRLHRQIRRGSRR